MSDNNKTNLIELYKIIVAEEHFFLAEHQKRIAFYTGLISSLLALIITALLKSTVYYPPMIMRFAGLLLIVISEAAKLGTGRIYKRFLETVTYRAKFEYDLGFTKTRYLYENGVQTRNWDETEQYIPTIHIESREKYKSSKDFINANLRMKWNYRFITWLMFNVSLGIGVILIIFSFCAR